MNVRNFAKVGINVFSVFIFFGNFCFLGVSASSDIDTDLFPVLGQFIAKHRLPEETQREVEEYWHATKSKQYHDSLEWLSSTGNIGFANTCRDLYIKGSDFRRVFNALALQRCIEKNDLHRLGGKKVRGKSRRQVENFCKNSEL